MTQTTEGTPAMTQTQELEARGRALTAAQGTRQLVESFELTETAIDGLDADYRVTTDEAKRAKIVDGRAAVVRARGWIMDELEARDAAAFERYLDGDASLASAFGVTR